MIVMLVLSNYSKHLIFDFSTFFLDLIQWKMLIGNDLKRNKKNRKKRKGKKGRKRCISLCTWFTCRAVVIVRSTLNLCSSLLKHKGINLKMKNVCVNRITKSIFLSKKKLWTKTKLFILSAFVLPRFGFFLK